jgi:hypothetical protein
MVGAVSPRRQFSDQVIAQLRNLFTEAGGEHVAGRLWRDVLNEEERASLGGNFGVAFRKDHHAAHMYHRLKPGITFERALLETACQVGWLFEATPIRGDAFRRPKGGCQWMGRIPRRGNALIGSPISVIRRSLHHHWHIMIVALVALAPAGPVPADTDSSVVQSWCTMCAQTCNDTPRIAERVDSTAFTEEVQIN